MAAADKKLRIAIVANDKVRAVAEWQQGCKGVSFHPVRCTRIALPSPPDCRLLTVQAQEVPTGVPQVMPCRPYG